MKKYLIAVPIFAIISSCSFSSTRKTVQDDAAPIQVAEVIKPSVAVQQMDSLTIYWPDFSRIDLATGNMPPKSDTEVIFVCAAAFTGELLSEFNHSNIAGNHVCGGVFHKGFKCGTNNGVFTWSKSGGWHFYNYSHKNSVSVLEDAARRGGMGFCQSLLYHNGKRFSGCFKPTSQNRYRALCELDGKLCVIDCARPLQFSKFMDGLQNLGVRNAIYCDMGYGWNYSWYRDNDGDVKELFSIPGKYTTNWLTFYK